MERLYNSCILSATFPTTALCSRNFHNVKLRIDFVEIWSFYRHSDLTQNQILVSSNSPKMSYVGILEVLNFGFSQFEQLSSPKSSQIQSADFLKLPFFDSLTLPKFDFNWNWSGGTIIKFQQSKTSYFESFWSIVHRCICL